MFISEIEPQRAQALAVTDRVRRVVAPNGGPMTYHGTNTYVVEVAAGCIVVDPGPDDDAHLEAVITAAGGRVHRILLTHGHADHVAGVARLARATGAGVAAAASARTPGYAVSQPLSDGSIIDGLSVIATPGHAPDHLCFQLGDVMLTGDHVMGWAPTSVLAPDGDAGAYRDSLARLAAIRSRLYLPGHGPAIRGTRRFVEALVARLDQRERALRDHIAEAPSEIDAIVSASYGALSPETRSVARRSVEALLVKLERDGRAVRDGDRWRIQQ